MSSLKWVSLFDCRLHVRTVMVVCAFSLWTDILKSNSVVRWSLASTYQALRFASVPIVQFVFGDSVRLQCRETFCIVFVESARVQRQIAKYVCLFTWRVHFYTCTQSCTRAHKQTRQTITMRLAPVLFNHFSVKNTNDSQIILFSCFHVFPFCPLWDRVHRSPDSIVRPLDLQSNWLWRCHLVKLYGWSTNCVSAQMTWSECVQRD